MSDGFRVVVEDVRAMQATFRREHDEYLAIKQKLTPVLAGTGDGVLDQVLGKVVEMLGFMHDRLAQNIADHAGKLGKAADSYEQVDQDAHSLYDNLMG